MAHLYLTEDNLKLGYSNGRVTVRSREGTKIRDIPAGMVDGMSVYGQAQLSTQLIRHCIEESKSITYYSDDGHYFGGIQSFDRLDPCLQKKQVYLTDNRDFCLCWSYRIVYAKIQNSLTMLKGLSAMYEFSEEELKPLRHSLDNIERAGAVEEILGYEGNAAKGYFRCLSRALADTGFAFSGRSSRPPKDPFNSMLSYGYSLLYRNIIGAIQKRGLHPYFAFMHKLKFGHAALASDLIEEYRAYLVDQTVVDLISSGNVQPADFYQNEAGAVYMDKALCKKLTEKIGDALSAANRYYLFYGNGQSCGFQVLLDRKMNELANALKQGDASLYLPFIWIADGG